MSTPHENLDVLIIGGGPSGLTALDKLQEMLGPEKSKQWKIRLVEANDRVGGRTETDAEGSDLGGAYIGPTQNRLAHYVDMFDIKLHPLDVTTMSTVQYFSGRSRKYRGTIPPLSLFGLLDCNTCLVKIQKMADPIHMTRPWESPNAAELDKMTMEEFLNKNCWTRDAKNALRISVRVLLATEAAEVSLLHYLWYVKQSGGIKRIIETEDGAQHATACGGMGQIFIKLGQRHADQIILNAAVRHLSTRSPDYVEVVTSCPKTGENLVTYHATHVILAIPPVQQLRINFDPPQEPLRIQSLQHWPMGHIMKTFMQYNEEFWLTKYKCNGMIVSDAGPICVSFPDTKPRANGEKGKPHIMGFLSSDQASLCCGMTKEERRDAIAEHYAKAFGNIEEFRHPIGYKERNMSDQPFAGGCHVGLCAPNVLTKFKIAHREHFHRVFVAGTECAYEFCGYMEGGIEAGERAARNVLVKRGELSQDKYDVIESYPDSKQMPFRPAEIKFWEAHLVPSVGQFLFLTSAVMVAVGAYWGKRKNYF